MSTPFIKDGMFSDGDHTHDEEIGAITLSDIEYIKSGNSILGKGSYGEVELAKIKRTGI
jgi:hypothetical protein